MAVLGALVIVSRVTKWPPSEGANPAFWGEARRRLPTRLHDCPRQCYMNICSHHQVVNELFTGFVNDDWKRVVNLSKLDRRSGSIVSDALRDRKEFRIVLHIGEVAWSAPCNGAELIESVPGGLTAYRQVCTSTCWMRAERRSVVLTTPSST